MEKTRRVAFILNPHSGRQRRGQSRSDALRRLLEVRRIGYEIFETQAAGHATELARAAAANGFDTVVACGGDGTVNEVASGLVRAPSALGILPAGSGNGLARGLRIPTDPLRALDAIVAGSIRTIDVGCVDDSRFFFNVFGTGFDAHLAERFHREAGKVRGKLPYFTLGTRAYFRFQPPHIEVDVEGERLSIAPLVLTVANGPQYGVGAKIAPEADFSDGWLDLVYMEKVSVLQALRAFPQLFFGTISRSRGRHHMRARELTLHLPTGTPVQFDGEVRQGAERMSVQVVPAALRVVVPASIGA